MKVIRADEMGMCFGVRDALNIASQVPEPSQVTIHGELVHNPAVTDQLSAAGFRQSSEQDRTATPPTQLVLITAHGISNNERNRLKARGKELIDTTCPLVLRVHDAALALQKDDRHVLLIGKHDHVEVRGVVEDLTNFTVIANVDEVQRYESKRLGAICQTTMPSEVVANVRKRIAELNADSDIQFIDTVCRPTKLRQRAMANLLPQVEAVIVVGGRNSNNTRRLVEACEKGGKPAVHVTCANEVDPTWLKQFQTVGLTAGTSTLDETINAVERQIYSLAKSERSASEKAKSNEQTKRQKQLNQST